MTRRIDNLRNIGIIAHIDAGKTTVTEHMLYYSGAKHRVGMVDRGTTEPDDDPEEQERGITIYSACVTFDWEDSHGETVHVNLLDTPGHVDFTAEVERCLRVLDGAVVVFSAREGVEAQSETVWRQANRYGVPRVAFINKMEREGADFERVFDEIDKQLPSEPVAIQIPAGQGPSHVEDHFSGVIDLISMKMLVFDSDDDGRTISQAEIPAEREESAILWREQMLEKLYGFSDELMEKALQDEEISPDLLRKVIRQCTIAQQIQPVLCGSALHGVGVQPILNAISEYLPSPLDRPPVAGAVVDKKGRETEASRKPESSEPICAMVFKVLPARTGDIAWVRIYSGTLKSNSRVLNPGKEVKENVSQLWRIHATRKDEQADIAEAGDIVGIIGMRKSITGDTLCDPRSPVLLESIEFPETVISMAIEPESTTERDKLASTLEMLKRQDPTLTVRSGETGQTLISGMGELHLEVIKNKLLREFKLKVKFHNPQVSYRETVAAPAEVEGVCDRMIAGKALYAKVVLKMAPDEKASGVTVLYQAPPDSIPSGLIDVVMEELRACGEGGGEIAGFPLTKMKVAVVGGEIHEEGSDEQAFRIAVNEAFRQGLTACGSVLLEPIMRLDITTPEDYMGDFVGDLQQRRAVIANTSSVEGISTIEAHAPLKELFGYSSAMRSLSQGRAGCSMEPLEYGPAPDADRKRFMGDDF